MLKKLFSLLIIYGFTMTLLADEATVQDDHVNSSSNSNEDQSLEKLICFETKKSIVFEDYFKTLPDEAKAEIQAFIKKVEQTLLSNNVFVNLVKDYQNLFSELNIVRQISPKVTLVFAFDKENWTDLVQTEDLDVQNLKNKISEDQLKKFTNDLVAMNTTLEKIEMSTLTTLENPNFYKAIKEKCGNQAIRIGLILA